MEKKKFVSFCDEVEIETMRLCDDFFVRLSSEMLNDISEYQTEMDADKYLEKQDADVEAKVVKGKSLKILRKYLDQGCPVVVWTTIGMGSPGGVQAVKSGYPLRSNNHAVVLSGYNPKNGKYLVSDSLAGKVWRGGKAFTRLFNAMGKQGVVLYD